MFMFCMTFTYETPIIFISTLVFSVPVINLNWAVVKFKAFVFANYLYYLEISMVLLWLQKLGRFLVVIFEIIKSYVEHGRSLGT